MSYNTIILISGLHIEGYDSNLDTLTNIKEEIDALIRSHPLRNLNKYLVKILLIKLKLKGNAYQIVPEVDGEELSLDSMKSLINNANNIIVILIPIISTLRTDFRHENVRNILEAWLMFIYDLIHDCNEVKIITISQAYPQEPTFTHMLISEIQSRYSNYENYIIPTPLALNALLESIMNIRRGREEENLLSYIPIYYDLDALGKFSQVIRRRDGAEYVVLVPNDLIEEIFKKREIDQRFLYWDEEKAFYWLNLIEHGNYALFARRIAEIELGAISKFLDKLNENNRLPTLKTIRLVNLGVGNARKDVGLINIAYTVIEPRRIEYIAIDTSMPLLQNTIRTILQEGLLHRYRRRPILVKLIFGDFLKIYRYKSIIYPRIYPRRDFNLSGTFYTLLGGSIGNFRENELLSALKKTMQGNDYFIVGAEFYEMSSEHTFRLFLETLARKYDNPQDRAFLLAPVNYISELKLANVNTNCLRVNEEENNLVIDTDVTGAYSDIPQSISVTAKIRDRCNNNENNEILLAFSNKYLYLEPIEKTPFVEYFKRKGFEYINSECYWLEGIRYCILIFQKK